MQKYTNVIFVVKNSIPQQNYLITLKNIHWRKQKSNVVHAPNFSSLILILGIIKGILMI